MPLHRVDETLALLKPDDRVTFLVGVIARESVELETTLLSYMRRLHDGEPANEPWAPPVRSQFKLLVESLRAHPLPEVLVQHRDLIHEVLAFALDAYQRRNRFVHDRMHIVRDGSIYRMTTGNPSADQLDFDQASAAAEDLVRATWRVAALTSLLIGSGGEWLGIAGNDFTVVDLKAIEYTGTDADDDEV